MSFPTMGGREVGSSYPLDSEHVERLPGVAKTPSRKPGGLTDRLMPIRNKKLGTSSDLERWSKDPCMRNKMAQWMKATGWCENPDQVWLYARRSTEPVESAYPLSLRPVSDIKKQSLFDLKGAKIFDTGHDIPEEFFSKILSGRTLDNVPTIALSNGKSVLFFLLKRRLSFALCGV